MCKPLVDHVCSVILELLRKKKFVFLGASWPVWTLNLASVRKVQASKTASLEQVIDLMREIQQQDVCDMEVDSRKCWSPRSR